MKRIRFFHIILLLFVLALVKTTSTEGEDGPPIIKPSRRNREKTQRVVTPPVVRVNPSHEVTAFGDNVEDARNLALEKAIDWIKEYLTAQWGESPWKPGQALLQQLDVIRPLGAPEIVPRDGNLQATRVTLEIELTPVALHTLHQEIRQVRRDERLHLAARILLGLIVLLGFIHAYLKMEDLSKGYYTRELRIAALVLLSLIGIVLLRLS